MVCLLLLSLLDALGLGECQKLLRHAGEAVGLGADVGHKFPHGLGVHVVLENGIREELDGRQGRLELVGGVGDELPLCLLRGLEAVGELVELSGQAAIFIGAVHLNLVVIFALPRQIHRGENLVHLPGGGQGESQGAEHHQKLHAQGNPGDVALQGLDDFSQILVHIGNVHAADGTVVEVDGHGGIAGEQAVGIAAIKDVLPRHGLSNLPQQHKFPHRAALGEGIVERAPLPVHNEHPGHVEVAQHRNHLGGILGGEGVHAGEGGGHQLRLILQRRLLGAVKELPGERRGVVVEKQQHQGREENIGRGKADMGVEGKPAASSLSV